MNKPQLTSVTCAYKPGRATVLATCLLIAALLLPDGAGQLAQAASPFRELLPIGGSDGTLDVDTAADFSAANQFAEHMRYLLNL